MIMRELIDKQLGVNDYCFGCGEKNPIGAKLNFYKISEKSLETEITPPNTWGGWGKIVHGGLQTVILDEMAGWTMIALAEKTGLTIKMEIEFYKPLFIEKKILARTEVIEENDKDVIVESYLLDEENDICTKGKFTFRVVDFERIKKIAGMTD